VDTLVSDVTFHILNKREKVSSSFIIEQIIRFIDENYMQDIKLIALANEYYINHIYLSRLFRNQTGKNFIDYLTEVRMRKANVLLKNKTLKVKDVAKMVGFENPYYFTKRYKAFFNVTPTDE
jgi:YesN/AraC family two-component response regulator